MTIGVDAKTFDCRVNKRYFAINDNKHAGLQGNVYAYFAAIAPTNGRRAVISRLVPYTDVDIWTVANLRRVGGKPSRNFPISNFIAKYCPPNTDISSLREDVYDQTEVTSIMSKPELKAKLKRLIPGLAASL